MLAAQQAPARRGTSPGSPKSGGGLLVVVIVALLTGADPMELFDTASQVQVDTGGHGLGPVGTPVDERGRFADDVLGSTEDS